MNVVTKRLKSLFSAYGKVANGGRWWQLFATHKCLIVSG